MSRPECRSGECPFKPRRRSCCLDRQGVIQAIPGIVIGLIAPLREYGEAP
jgi:hypothetical protein